MYILLYGLLLLFLVPANIVAYRKVMQSKPLGWFTNNIVVSQLRMTEKLKVAYWVIFYFFHLWILLVAADRGAIVTVALLGAYMVITPMLQSALRKHRWSITSVPVAGPPQNNNAGNPPPIP